MVEGKIPGGVGKNFDGYGSEMLPNKLGNTDSNHLLTDQEQKVDPLTPDERRDWDEKYYKISPRSIPINTSEGDRYRFLCYKFFHKPTVDLSGLNVEEQEEWHSFYGGILRGIDTGNLTSVQAARWKYLDDKTMNSSKPRKKIELLVENSE